MVSLDIINIEEVHSSDICAKCLRERYHVHRGEVDAEATEALYRGLIAGEAMRMWHEGDDVPKTSDVALVLASGAADAVDETLANENRPLSKATAKKRTEIIGTVAKHLLYYIWHVHEPDNYKLIGCELPIRVTIDVDGEPVEFASHLDRLGRNVTSNHLLLDDDKWRDQQPSYDYLRRNEQFAMYAYGVRFGEVKVGDVWLHFGEWPVARWIDLARCKPYSRKTVDGVTGEEFAAGDNRPKDRIIRHVAYDDDSKERIERMFIERVRMMRAGFWPASPDPIGCSICQSRQWCEAFDA